MTLSPEARKRPPAWLSIRALLYSLMFAPLQLMVPALWMVRPSRKRVPAPLMLSVAPSGMVTLPLSWSVESPLQFIVPVTVKLAKPLSVPLLTVRLATVALEATATMTLVLMTAVSCVPGGTPPLHVAPLDQRPEATAVMVVGALTVKFEALVPVPAAVVTAIGPVVAPLGTTAVICASLSTL